MEKNIENDMREFVPLDKAPEEIKTMVDAIQKQVRCTQTDICCRGFKIKIE